MLQAFGLSLRMSLTCSMRRPVDILAPLAFFVMVTSLFPLGIGPDKPLLLRIAPGIIWVSALLASLLGLHRLYEPDLTDGSLEQMLLCPEPTILLIIGKIAAHWLSSGVTLAIISPVVALQYGLEAASLGTLFLSLVLGTSVFSLIGAIGAALSLGARGGSVLMALILMPLYVPVLILGSGAVTASLAGTDPSAYLSLLGALTCATLALAPWATTVALRLSVE